MTTHPLTSLLDILASQYGIRHIRVSGYNSQANGLVESKHFNVREAIMKTCRGEESGGVVSCTKSLGRRVTIRRSTATLRTTWYNGVHPLLPFDNPRGLLPSSGCSRLRNVYEDLVALRARQLANDPTTRLMRQFRSPARIDRLRCFEKSHRSRIVDLTSSPCFGPRSETLRSRKLLTERRSLVI